MTLTLGCKLGSFYHTFHICGEHLHLIDMDSFKLHVARANYQTYIHLAFDKPHVPPRPTDHGWTLHNGKCVPLRCTEEALPRSLDASLRQKRHEVPTDLGDTKDISDTDKESDSDS